MLLLAAAAAAAAAAPHNVLLIIVDDLRPEIGQAYGQRHVYTPSLDAFAATALVFDRAYTQFAVCCPSRSSFLTGRQPDTTMAWTNADSWRRTGKSDPENWISLPQHFKHHGYLTLGGGKTFHPGEPLLWDLPKSWSQKFVTFNTAQPLGYFNFELVHCPGDHDSLDTWCPLDGSLNQHYDYRLANWTINALRYASRSPDNGVPWFIAAGFRRPHTPFKMPRQYWELYNESEIALASNSAWPTVPHRQHYLRVPRLLKQLG